MKLKPANLVLLLTIVLATSCARTPKVLTGDLRFCEAVCAVGDTILITNFGSDSLNPLTRTDFSGYIMQLVGDELSLWYPADGTLSAPKGMAVAGDYLYVADVSRVHVIHRHTRRKYTIPLSSEDTYANHIAVIGDILLLSVTDNGHILALDLRPDGSPSLSGFQLLTTVPGANGICYAGGRLFIASYNPSGISTPENVIYTIDDFLRPNPRPFISRPGQYDGLAADDKYLYFTDWNNASIGRISLSDTTDLTLITPNLDTPLSGPAQLTLYSNRLLIPDLPTSRLIIY